MDAEKVPELIDIYETLLSLVKEEKKEEFIRIFLDSLLENIELADNCAKTRNIDFITAFEYIENKKSLDKYNDFMIEH